MLHCRIGSTHIWHVPRTLFDSSQPGLGDLCIGSVLLTMQCMCTRVCLACAGDGAVPIPLPLYLLGLDIQERWTFAVDITAARDLFMVRLMQCSWPARPYAATFPRTFAALANALLSARSSPWIDLAAG